MNCLLFLMKIAYGYTFGFPLINHSEKVFITNLLTSNLKIIFIDNSKQLINNRLMYQNTKQVKEDVFNQADQLIF